MRKVNETERKDRSAALVPGAAAESSSGASPSGGGGAPQGGLAGALQDALAKRKQKVSGSGKCFPLKHLSLSHDLIAATDDEKDDDDEW